MKLNTLVIAASVLFATFFAGSAMADTCKDVNISVKNDGKKEIKV